MEHCVFKLFPEYDIPAEMNGLQLSVGAAVVGGAVEEGALQHR
jgi:hypothetical protein